MNGVREHQRERTSGEKGARQKIHRPERHQRYRSYMEGIDRKGMGDEVC